MKRLVLAIAAGCALCAPTIAQPSVATYEAVREGLIAVWDAMGLTVRNATLTDGEAAGFAQYQRRAGHAFSTGETIHVYAEVLGYQSAPTANGKYVRDLEADLALLDSSGVVRGTQPGFYSSETVSATPLLETYLSFTVTLSDFAPGDYTLRYTVRDRAAGSETSFDLPVTLTAPAAAESAGDADAGG
jgi:hypothetical protein